MPRIVERRADAPFTEFVIQFRVSRKADGQIVGFVMPWLGDHGGTVEQAAEELGRPAAVAFRQALAQCEQEGLRHVWVDDPDNLFAPDKRPLGLANLPPP